MNDRILNLRSVEAKRPLGAERFEAVTLAFILKLGQEIFAEQPLLHREQPDRAKRLAWLIVSKAPTVNAALFAAPAAGCRPDQVSARLAELGIDVMAALWAKERTGTLNPVSADWEVWRRMAA